ncbi:cysteine hydrolase family protein [Aliihoeflea sp. 40Bstr573]|uniref:cysteine hydrolase family protein n=1 Tax=Aliihoeflea sp. 40Bstr573 TaxID=2696467 RepID=UPI002094A1C9|nr:cysteine hydrolase family protein [Aliihoeflea sp. 40Bstr573]MCO6388351.1 isochorismatase family protein [Aliihoeflea sp. 40Bstr573]
MAKTLLELAGADLTPPKLGDTVLVVIDAQREYVDGKLPLPGAPAALTQIARLLQKARAEGAPVVHVQHKGKAGGLFDPATTSFALADEAAAKDGEAVVEKGLPNAFAGTSLKDVLEASGRKRLVLAGFMTHMCVSSTARAALDLGFQTVVVSDASATRDLPVPGAEGEVLTAVDLHRAELAMLADRFAIVCTTDDLAG